MKKTVSLLLVFLLTLLPALLTSCEKEPEIEQAKIGVLAGPTGMGLARLMTEENERYAFSLYSDPSIAATDLVAGNLDLLCLPTNTAANLYAKTNGKVRVLAVNCLGSLYVIAKKSIAVKSLSDLAGKTVFASVPTSTTKPILESLFGKAEVTAEIEMTADHDSLVAKIAMGTADIAVLPEPKVSAAILQNADYEVKLNLGDEWQTYTGKPLVMGCIAVRSEFYEQNPEWIRTFLADAEKSVAAIADPELLDASAQTIVDAGVLPKFPLAKKALSNLYGSIVLLKGEEMKDALAAFYGEIGQEAPKEDFYIIAN